MKPLLTIIALGVILLGIILLGYTHSDVRVPYSYVDQTLGDLNYLGHVVALVLNKGASVDELDSIDSLVQAALKYGVGDIERDNSSERCRRDRWGRPFRWKVRTDGEETTIRITSDGIDRISQGGGGDDLFVEIRKHGTEPATMQLHPERKR
jgi:hypothetical protein